MFCKTYRKFKVNFFIFYFYRVTSILKENLPACFKEKNFVNSLDESSKKWLQVLFKNLQNNTISNATNIQNTKSMNDVFSFSNNLNLNNLGNPTYNSNYDNFYFSNVTHNNPFQENNNYYNNNNNNLLLNKNLSYGVNTLNPLNPNSANFGQTYSPQVNKNN